MATRRRRRTAKGRWRRRRRTTAGSTCRRRCAAQRRRHPSWCTGSPWRGCRLLRAVVIRRRADRLLRPRRRNGTRCFSTARGKCDSRRRCGRECRRMVPFVSRRTRFDSSLLPATTGCGSRWRRRINNKSRRRGPAPTLCRFVQAKLFSVVTVRNGSSITHRRLHSSTDTTYSVAEFMRFGFFCRRAQKSIQYVYHSHAQTPVVRMPYSAVLGPPPGVGPVPRPFGNGSRHAGLQTANMGAMMPSRFGWDRRRYRTPYNETGTARWRSHRPNGP